MKNAKEEPKKYYQFLTNKDTISGITLIALVVTIIILLILSGITISYTMGEEGIIQKAKEASFKQEVSGIKEQFELQKLLGSLGQTGELESEKIARINKALEQTRSGIEKIQLWESNLTEIVNMLQRIIGLLSQIKTSGANIEVIQLEIESIMQEINILGSQKGELSFSCAYGIEGEILEITVADCSVNFLGEYNSQLIINIDTEEKVQKSLEDCVLAISKVQFQRSSLGSKQNRLGHHTMYLEKTKEVLEKRIESEEIKNNNLAFVGINTIENMLLRLDTLTEKAINVTLPDREMMEMEILQYLEEIDTIAKNTKNKNHIGLLNGEWLPQYNVTIKQLQIEELKVDSEQSAQDSNNKVKNAITLISQISEKNEDETENTQINFDIPEKWRNKLKVIDNELVYIGTDEIERVWSSNIGIQTSW